MTNELAQVDGHMFKLLRSVNGAECERKSRRTNEVDNDSLLVKKTTMCFNRGE